MKQISNNVFCDDFLFDLDIKTSFLPSQYNDFPFLVIDNFLSQDICYEINKSIKKNSDYEKALLLPSDNLDNSFLNEQIRKTNIYKLEKIYKKIYERNFRFFQKEIEISFSMGIILFTTNHSDDLNSQDSFSGGELVFNFLYDKHGNNIEIKPTAGQLIVFLSNPYFTHEVKNVTKGRRISLVQWHNTILN